MDQTDNFTPGRRIADNAKWYGRDPDAAQPRDYGRTLDNGEWVWRCRTPNGLYGVLSQHQVTEHQDGTITVEPSILCEWPHSEHPVIWHGYLKAGVWETLPDTTLAVPIADPLPGHATPADVRIDHQLSR